MKIAKTASLPLDVIRGTIKERQVKVCKIAEEIFDKIVEDPKDLSIKRLQQITQDTLTKTAGDGRKIDVQIKDLPECGYGGSEEVISENGIAKGFEIKIPTKDGALKEEFFAKFMHEVTHVINQLMEPKSIAVLDSAKITAKQAKRANNFYQNVLYDTELFEWFNPISTRLKQAIYLRGIDAKEKIKILQECRHRLTSELMAYMQEEKFDSRGYKYGIKSMLPPEYDSIMIEDKLDYLEKEIARLIKKVRKNGQ